MLLHRPFALAALAAAAAAAPCTRNYTSHANVDYNGGDLPNQPAAHVSTPAECAALCCANSTMPPQLVTLGATKLWQL